MILEDLDMFEAFWLTIITLGTIGYGDLIPQTNEGRVFTVFIILLGLGAVGIGAQAAIEFIVSPNIRSIRQHRRAERRIKKLENHCIICGEGELVDRTVDYLQRRAEIRLQNQREAIALQVDVKMQRYFGRKPRGIRARLCRLTTTIYLNIKYFRHQSDSLLDILVVLTQDKDYVEQLTENNMQALHDDPTDDRALRRANINKARAMIVMLENDADALLTVLTGRSRNSDLYITAATIEDDIAFKITRVGANNVLPPYEIAGRFLNNATLRPVVNDFYNSILFDQKASEQIVQLYLSKSSRWVGKTIGSLKLRERFKTGILGLRKDYGRYYYAPTDDFVLDADDIVLTVTPGRYIPDLQRDCCDGMSFIPDAPNWQRIPTPHHPLKSDKVYSLIEAEENIAKLDKHYVICGTGPIVRASLDNLNPEQPFVFLSDDQTLVTEMQQRGFRVVYGKLTQDEVLQKAGIKHALAIMIDIEDRALSVLTTLSCRAINKELMIVAATNQDDMIPRLRRAGADRVVSPFRIAAQFVMLATTRPVVSDFLQHVLFNYETSTETTELHIQDNSPWIGHSIEETGIGETYRAWVVGIRQPNGRFRYAPKPNHIIGIGEILIVITPMEHGQTIRLIAHGGSTHRPRTLRYVDND